MTNEVRHDNFYYTDNVAWRDENGYFWFVGRADDVIKSSGYRISPFEVESALMTHPAVVECTVTGVPDDIRGQLKSKKEGDLKTGVILNITMHTSLIPPSGG